MSDDRIDEILRRLEALEGHTQPHQHPPPPPPGPHGGDFDEKRVVDLIVRLVTDHVDQVVLRRIRENRPEELDERRLADQIVDRVTERVDIMLQKRLLELHKKD